MARGLQITRTKKSKSYLPNEIGEVTRIEVTSELFKYDREYQNKTIDTQYREYCEMINKTIKTN